MSRIGNKPVDIPDKVKVNIDNEGGVSVEGPKGKLSWKLPRQIKAEIARILKDEGYISDYSIDTSAAHPRIKITNKLANRTSAIAGLRRVSRPGLRRYVGADEIPRVLGGMGLAILSTSHGVLSGREAKKQKVGGELLAYVW